MRYEEATMEIVELGYSDILTLSCGEVGDGFGEGEGGTGDDFGMQ